MRFLPVTWDQEGINKTYKKKSIIATAIINKVRSSVSPQMVRKLWYLCNNFQWSNFQSYIG